MKIFNGDEDEILGFFVFILLIIGVLSIAVPKSQNKIMCVNGYLFTRTSYPVQMLDSNKNPITCENK